LACSQTIRDARVKRIVRPVQQVVVLKVEEVKSRTLCGIQACALERANRHTHRDTPNSNMLDKSAAELAGVFT
jgi:hypothetical protein